MVLPWVEPHRVDEERSMPWLSSLLDFTFSKRGPEERQWLRFFLTLGLKNPVPASAKAPVHLSGVVMILNGTTPPLAALSPAELVLGGISLVALAAFACQWYRTQHALRKAADFKASREQLEWVLESSQDAFWDYDLSTGRVYRNPRWRAVLGYTEATVASTEQDFLDLIHPDDLPTLTESLQAVHTPHHPGFVQVEYRIRSASGEWHWFLDRAKIVERNEQGLPVRIVGTATDISERRRVEEALKRSERLFRQSQDVAGVGGWELDIATRAVYWTHETFRIHDLDSQETTMPWEEAIAFYPPDSQSIVREAFHRAQREGISFDLELGIKTRQERHLWIRIIGRAERDHLGAISKLFGAVQDISQKKADDEARQEFQGKLLETQKLESLGVLAGGVAHDFNNLLTAILANAQLSRMWAEPGTDLDEHLVGIERATVRAADLCHQLLAYAGRSPLLRQTSGLNDLVHDTVKLLELSVSKQAVLELELSSHSPMVEVDRAQMSQVMMNLVMNASEALPSHGGIIRIRTGSAWLTQDMLSRACIGQSLAANQYAFLEVSDTGCGMAQETLAKIFDPFFTTKFTGRGLGLAAVLGIVRAHGGGFFVESIPGEGSTFRMCLPLRDTPAELPPALVEPTLTVAPKTTPVLRILLVDDEPSVRDVAATILRRSGCEVQTAADGIEAVESFRRDPSAIDVVVMDLTMPGLDGVSAAQQIRALKADVRVLLMSGYTEKDPALFGAISAPHHFLRKPFTREDLLEKVRLIVAEQPGLTA